MNYDQEIEITLESTRAQLKQGLAFATDYLAREIERIANLFRCTFDEAAFDVLDRIKKSQLPPTLIKQVLSDSWDKQVAAQSALKAPRVYDRAGALECWSISDSSRLFFAFVEDVNGFNAEVAESDERRLACWGNLLSARRDEDIPAPESIVWFDAVQANFFMRLSWREEDCPIGDVEASVRRRRNLRSLQEGRDAFSSFAIPMSPAIEFESSCMEAFQPCSWHLLMLGEQAGTPVAVLPDFGIDNYPDAPIQNVMYAGACRGDEFANLNEIFSLNFLPDLGVRGDA